MKKIPKLKSEAGKKQSESYCPNLGPRNIYMKRTNIDIDEKLLREATALTGIGTKKDIVNYALTELVRRMKRKKMLALEGKIKWSGSLHEMRGDRT